MLSAPMLSPRRLVAAALLSGVALLATPLRAQDTANSSASFWVEEAARQRGRAAPQQRVRRLMPRREFARPTIWQDRNYAARPATPAPNAPLVPPAATTPGQDVPPGAPPLDTAAVPTEGGVPSALAPATETPTLAAPTAAPNAIPLRKFTIGVAGDSLAQWLAMGLTETFPASQGVTVVSKARDSSGLVRDDFFDWPKALRDFVTTTPMDVLVVMVGSNDRQALRGATGVEEPLSKGWEALYGNRVEQIASIAAEKKIPVLWVGLPVMKSERFSLDMAAINEIYRTRASAAGAHFVDVFDAFSDERGQYRAFGPDINGTIVKLRSTDGVHFTLPGARKLAHFLEGDIRKLREPEKPTTPAPVIEAAVPPATRTDGSPEATSKPAAVTVAPAVPEKPAVGPVIPLTAAPLAPRGELLGASNAPARLTDAQRAAFEAQVFRDGGTNRTR